MIMMSLLNKEQIIKSYIKSERYDESQETLKKTALTMIRLGKITVQDIESCFPTLSKEIVEEIEQEVCLF